MSSSEKGYLLELKLRREKIADFSEYPFSLPSVANLESLSFHPKVTFLIGENGSGKSTLLEAIAVSLGLNPEGGSRNASFATSNTHSILGDFVYLSRSHKRPRDLYFLRAESFYNVATYMDDKDDPLYSRNVYLSSYGGRSLHEQSHGESFIATMSNRLGGNGVYLFDEPEAALSPSRQLSALAVFHKLVGSGSQLIIATHSPILMAYPDATIYHFSESGIEEVSYEETEHYTITKEFLNKPEKMLKYLLVESEQ